MFRRAENFFERLIDRAQEIIANFGPRPVSTDEPEARQPEARNTDEPEGATIEEIEAEQVQPEIEDTDEDWDNFDDWLTANNSVNAYDAVENDLKLLSDYQGDPDALRVVRYATSEEAQAFLDEAGLEAFAEVLFDEDTDTFTIAVHDSPGVSN